MQEPIYLDHNATTPVGRRVLEKMLPYFCEVYGNAASINHLHGNKTKQAVDQARQTIAKALGRRKESEIVFTSGATAAILAILETGYPIDATRDPDFTSPSPSGTTPIPL